LLLARRAFRAGWQSLLASLGTDVEGFSETEAKTDQGMTSAEQTLAEAGGKSSVSTSTPDAGAGLRMWQETEKGTGPASGGLKMSQAAPDRSLRSPIGCRPNKDSSSRTEEKETSANRESESASGSRRPIP